MIHVLSDMLLAGAWISPGLGCLPLGLLDLRWNGHIWRDLTRDSYGGFHKCYICITYLWSVIYQHIYIYIYVGFHKWGYPKMWFTVENPIKMDDFGVPHVWKTTIWSSKTAQPTAKKLAARRRSYRPYPFETSATQLAQALPVSIVCVYIYIHTLHYITLHYITLPYLALRYVKFRYITLH